MPKYLIKRLIEKSGDDMKNETGKREKLIMSAIGLFAEYGYDKVSIRQIAADAGANSSMISYYFGSKQGLYEAILRELINNFDEFIGVLRDEKLDPREGLRIYTRSISDIFHKYPPAYVKLIYREVIKPSHVFQDVVLNKFKSNSAVLLKMIERGKEQGIFLKTLDEKTVLLMLISIINLYFLTKPLHSMVIEQDESFTESYLRQVLDILLRGIEVKGHDKT